MLVVGECLDLDETWLCPSVSHLWCPKLRILKYLHDEPISLDPEVWVCFLRSHPHIIGLKPSFTIPPKKSFAPLGFSHSLLSYSTYNKNPIPITLFTSLQRLGISFYESFMRPDWQDHFITRPLLSLTVLSRGSQPRHFECCPWADTSIYAQFTADKSCAICLA